MSSAQFTQINLSQILISIACYRDAIESKREFTFDKGLIEYVVTNVKDDIGVGEQFSEEVTDIKSAVWSEGPKCYKTLGLSDSLELDLGLQMAYCFLAIIVFRYQRDHNGLSDKACRALGAIAFLISIGLMAHVLLQFGQETEPNEENPLACPE